jgi:hypothetical protein
MRSGSIGRIVRALWLFLALAGGSSGPLGLAHATLRDDVGCAGEEENWRGVGIPLTVTAAHPVTSNEKPAHCAICHWLHSGRWDAPPTATVQIEARGFAAVPSFVVRGRGSNSVPCLPARSPPPSSGLAA